MAPTSTSWRDKLTGGSSSMPAQGLNEHFLWWLRSFGAAYAVFAIALYMFTPDFIGDHMYRVYFWTAIPFVLVTFTWPLIAGKYQRQKERLILGSVLAVVAIFSTLMISSYFSCWCCKREADMVGMCEMSLEATKVLERHKIDYW